MNLFPVAYFPGIPFFRGKGNITMRNNWQINFPFFPFGKTTERKKQVPEILDKLIPFFPPPKGGYKTGELNPGLYPFPFRGNTGAC
jgi:hypothetical protein